MRINVINTFNFWKSVQNYSLLQPGTSPLHKTCALIKNQSLRVNFLQTFLKLRSPIGAMQLHKITSVSSSRYLKQTMKPVGDIQTMKTMRKKDH